MKFIDIHSGMKGITREQLESEHKKDLEAQKGTDVHFERAWADPATGTVICMSDGPDRETVSEVHRKAGHTFDAMYELPIELD
jgi:hypothetical protein